MRPRPAARIAATLALLACGQPAYFPHPLPALDTAGESSGGDDKMPCSGDDPYVERILHVENKHSSDVAVYWVDNTCAEIFYGTLTPGQAYDQSTSIGHVWAYREASTTTLLAWYEVTDADAQSVVIP